MNDYIAVINFGDIQKIKPVRGETSPELVADKLKGWLKSCNLPHTSLAVYTYEQWFALEGREF
jgi:hypothetical protein